MPMTSEILSTTLNQLYSPIRDLTLSGKYKEALSLAEAGLILFADHKQLGITPAGATTFFRMSDDEASWPAVKASILIKLGHFKEAEILVQECINIRNSKYDSKNMLVYSPKFLLVQCEIGLGKYDLAKQHLREIQDFVGNNPSYKDMQMSCYKYSGIIFFQESNFVMAKYKFENALHYHQNNGLEKADMYYYEIITYLARICIAEKDYNQSDVYLREATAILEQKYPAIPHPGKIEISLATLDMLLDKEEYAKAELLCANLQEMTAGLFSQLEVSPYHPYLIKMALDVALLALAKKDIEKAEKELLKVSKANAEGNHSDLTLIRRYEKARSLFVSAITSATPVKPPVPNPTQNILARAKITAAQKAWYQPNEEVRAQFEKTQLHDLFVDDSDRQRIENMPDYNKAGKAMGGRIEFFGDAVKKEIKENDCQQVVIIGGGFNPLAIKKNRQFHGSHSSESLYSQVGFFEVEREAILLEKERILQEKGIDPNASYIKADPDKDDFIPELIKKGIDPEKNTFFLLEGNNRMPIDRLLKIFNDIQKTFSTYTISIDLFKPGIVPPGLLSVGDIDKFAKDNNLTIVRAENALKIVKDKGLQIGDDNQEKILEGYNFVMFKK